MDPQSFLIQPILNFSAHFYQGVQLFWKKLKIKFCAEKGGKIKPLKFSNSDFPTKFEELMSTVHFFKQWYMKISLLL